MSRLLSLRKKIFSASLVFAALIIAASPANAIPEGLISFYSSNDILFYDPDAKEIVCAAPDSASLVGDDNLEKAYNYFISKGLADYLAAAAVGNIAVESGGDPTIKFGGSKTTDVDEITNLTVPYGLIQWNPGSRLVGLFEDAGINGELYELAPQLDLVWWHMSFTTPTGRTNFLEGFKSTDNVAQATNYFRANIEGTSEGAVNRRAAAELALETYGSGLPAASVKALGDTSCAGAVDGNLIQTILNYAWPEHHSAPYLDTKPAYAAAIATALENGEYVGSSTVNPGIDCGGFVTRAMRDSGADPNYNSAQGNTTVQYSYLNNPSNGYIELDNPTTADLLPGDIAIRTASEGGGHTFIYVGSVVGFGEKVASASTGSTWRAPMAGVETPADPDYHWFRKV